MTLFSRFLHAQPFDPTESWIVLLVAFASVFVLALLFCGALDAYESWQQARIAERERRLDEHHVAQLLRNVEPVSEQASKAMFDVLMTTGQRCQVPAHVVPPNGTRIIHAEVWPVRR